MSEVELEIKSINNTVDIIKSIIITDEYKKLRENDYLLYKNKLEAIFPTFSDNYPKLFELVINNKNLSFLDVMLKNIIDISNGEKDQREVEKKLGEDLAESFLYPSLPDHIKKKVKR